MGRMVKIISNICIIVIVIVNISCVQLGGKIYWSDNELEQIRKNNNPTIYNWDTYKEKWSIKELRIFLHISARHTVFSSKEPYSIRFDIDSYTDSLTGENTYIQFTIKDLIISGESGKDYQTIANSFFPVTQKINPVKYYPHSASGFYLTDSVFPFSFEKLYLKFTIELETTDNIETKTIECYLLPHYNPPHSILMMAIIG
jgi:hypothetical protein